MVSLLASMSQKWYATSENDPYTFANMLIKCGTLLWKQNNFIMRSILANRGVKLFKIYIYVYMGIYII